MPKLAQVPLDLATVLNHVGEFDGARLAVRYTVDAGEHARRRAASVGAVTDEQVLAGLLELSSGDLRPVPPRFATVLTDPVSAGLCMIVEDADGATWGSRCSTAAVEVLGIEIETPSWARSREIAHRFAGYGPRTVRVDKVPARDLAIILTEASYYGIGVVTAGEAAPLIAPQPYRPRRWTSARWRFSELVYEQFLRRAGLTS